jgi:hypothetical protein
MGVGEIELDELRSAAADTRQNCAKRRRYDQLRGCDSADLSDRDQLVT